MKNLIKKINVFWITKTLSRLVVELLIVFVWVRYFVSSLWLALLISACVMCLIETGLWWIKKLKNKKTGATEKTKQMIEDISFTFLFSDDSTNLAFFNKLAGVKHSCQKKSKYVIVNNPTSKVVLIPFFTYNNFSCDNLIYCYNLARNEHPNKLVICCNEIDSNVFKLQKHLTDMKIILLNKTDTYHKLLVPYNTFPEIKQTHIKETRPTRYDLLSFSLNKKRTKGYLFASIVLLISSFIVRKNLYYVIMSSILLLLALISYTNPRFNKKTEFNPLD